MSRAPKPNPKNLLYRMRIDRGFKTQQALANRIGVSQVHISRLENDKETLTKDMAIRLANVLECHWAELLGDDTPRLTPQETAVVDLFRGLEERDRDAAFRFLDAMAKPAKKITG